jgi:hypothetical protein
VAGGSVPAVGKKIPDHSTWLARMAGDTAGENNIQIDKQ